MTGFCAIICEANAQKTGALAVQCRPLAAGTMVDKLVIPLLPKDTHPIFLGHNYTRLHEETLI